MTMQIPAAALAELAPTGTLRVGLNLSNFLLVNRERVDGEPQGVAPDLGRELARRLGVPIKFVTYPGAGEVTAAASADEWDAAFIGADPLRAGEVAFSAAYTEIEATYLVRGESPIHTLNEVDRPGVRIAVADKSAYDMFLRRTLAHATLVRADGLEGSYQLFVAEKLDVLAGLKPRLLTDQAKTPGSRILAGNFTTIQQAIGTPAARTAAAAYLRVFAEEVKTGLVAQLIAKHAVQGLSVAPPAQALKAR